MQSGLGLGLGLAEWPCIIVNRKKKDTNLRIRTQGVGNTVLMPTFQHDQHAW